MADENKNNLTEQNIETEESISVVSEAMDIIQTAKEGYASDLPEQGLIVGDKPPESNSINNSFIGLPIETLIGSPFIAAAKAQQDLSDTYVEGVWKLAYGTQEKDTVEKNKPNINTLNLSFDRPVISEQDGTVSTQKFSVNAPILSLVPVPAFTMDEVVVDFEMEVKNSETSSKKSHQELNSNVNYKSVFGLGASITGSVTADSEHKRETDTSATYKIHARAVQHPPAAGMNKLTDLLTHAMEPIIIPDNKPKT